MKDMEQAFYRADSRTEFEMDHKPTGATGTRQKSEPKIHVTLASGEVVMATPDMIKKPRLFNGVVQYPEPILRHKARRVEEGAFGTKLLEAEGQRMLQESERLKAAGLAHCQLGGYLALVTVPRYRKRANEEPRADLWCVANPEIVEAASFEKGEEGCLSLAGIIDQAMAPTRMAVRFQLLDGTKVEEYIEGYAARVWYHEIKHLEGELLCDRIKPPWRKIYLRHVQKKLKEAARAEEAEGGRMSPCNKSRFTSREQATRGATSVANHNGDRRMRPYFCPSCKGWHLSSVGRST